MKYTKDEFFALSAFLEAGPEKYTKPVRFYCDVDGVVMPLIQRNGVAGDGETAGDITVFAYNSDYSGFEEEKTTFFYNEAIVKRLVEISERDDVDFVWLTGWRENAPHVLDPLLGIKSVGFLPWAKKFSDYSHAFKGVAVEQDQASSPSDFVWVDDFANHPRHEGLPYFSREESEYDEAADDFTVFIEERLDAGRYHTVTTEGSVGLLASELDTIIDWLDSRKEK